MGRIDTVCQFIYMYKPCTFQTNIPVMSMYYSMHVQSIQLSAQQC